MSISALIHSLQLQAQPVHQIELDTTIAATGEDPHSSAYRRSRGNMHANRNVPLQAVPHGHVTARRGCHRGALPVWVPPSQGPSLLACVCSARAAGIEGTTTTHERVPVKLVVNKGGPPALDGKKQQSTPSGRSSQRKSILQANFTLIIFNTLRLACSGDVSRRFFQVSPRKSLPRCARGTSDSPLRSSEGVRLPPCTSEIGALRLGCPPCRCTARHLQHRRTDEVSERPRLTASRTASCPRQASRKPYVSAGKRHVKLYIYILCPASEPILKRKKSRSHRRQRKASSKVRNKAGGVPAHGPIVASSRNAETHLHLR